MNGLWGAQLVTSLEEGSPKRETPEIPAAMRFKPPGTQPGVKCRAAGASSAKLCQAPFHLYGSKNKGQSFGALPAGLCVEVLESFGGSRPKGAAQRFREPNQNSISCPTIRSRILHGFLFLSMPESTRCALPSFRTPTAEPWYSSAQVLSHLQVSQHEYTEILE